MCPPLGHLACPLYWPPGRPPSLFIDPSNWLCGEKAEHGSEAGGPCCPLGFLPPHQGLVLDLLPDELVLAQGVAGLARDGIDGALLHLLLDGAVQHEERLPRTLLWAEAGRGWRGTSLLPSLS